jgi:hypothetical protein
MTKNIIALIVLATALNLVPATIVNASSEKKKSKKNESITTEITGEDLTAEMLDPAKAQSPELRNQLQAIRTKLAQYKAAMTGRTELLSKTTEPVLSAEMQKKVEETETSKQSSQVTNLERFPTEFEGSWAGTALIDQMDFSKAIQKREPQAVASYTGNMHAGRLGFCELIFEANADGAKLQKWPEVTFRIGPDEVGLIPGARVGAASFVGTAPARSTILNDGGIKNSQQLFYRLTKLKSGVIEQDSGEKSITIRRGRQITSEMRENVVYYALVGPDQMYIYIAQIDYLSNGDFKSKLLMHGILRRIHETA